MVDRHAYRLSFAQQTYGVIPANFDDCDAAEFILDGTRRRGGTISVPGVYAGFIHGFLFGGVFEKGITFRTGQTHVQKYMPELLEAIGEDRLRPQEIISHRLKLGQAAEGYRMFDKKEDECRKVILTP